LLSCNYTKHLAQNQTLLAENRLTLNTQKPLKYKGETESVILSLAYPRANTHVFDLGFLPKYKLWKYNNNFQKYEKDPMNPKIIKHKVERPVLLDTNMVIRSKLYIGQYMLNLGYFYANVDYDIRPKGKQSAIVHFTIDAGKNYTMRHVMTNSESEDIQAIINENSAESILVIGEPYTKINCGLERERLYKIIRNKGYFDFKSDNITFTIDTSNKEKIKSLLDDPFSNALTYKPNTESKEVDVHLNVAQSRDSSYAQLYRINKVKVVINNPFSEADPQAARQESELEDITFNYATLPINRKVIARNIFIHRGDLFNTSDYEVSISRLNQLGVFQLISIQYEKVQGQNDKLDCIVTLNMSPKMDLVYLTDISTSDDDYVLGTGLGITYRNRNLAHGSNLFSLRAIYSTEFRNDNFLTGSKKFYQSGNNFNLSGNLTFPKFIVPFNQNIFSKRNMPYTTLGANYSLIQRLKNYTIINISGNFGYSWQETPQKNWKLNPIFLTVTQVPDKYLSESFRLKRQTNSYLKNTFSNNVIQGENMLFEYKSKPKTINSNFSTIKIGAEEAGTLLTGINSLYKRFTNDTIKAIAHYIKVDVDVRRYINRRKSQWVSRFMTGVGCPIGDSKTLPYIKQYSAGGAFSNRGWPSRNLGPGHSVDTSFKSGFAILDKTGDIKIEANTEYRFNLLKLFSGAINLKGAAFIDAGNIWLMNKDSSVIGGEFNVGYLWQDIAISSGVGLRLDFSFFVFRVDLGYPIKQPQVSANNGFMFNQLKLNNGIWNLAFGYPF
jgi:outer membrane protein assembly factor BamA